MARSKSKPKPKPEPDAWAILPGTESRPKPIRIPQDLVLLLQPIESLAEDPANPRRAKPGGHDHLVGLLESFGWTDPLVVTPEGAIEAGHQRLATARLVGATHVPVVRTWHEGMDVPRFNIAHNRSNERVAEWDDDALGQLLRALKDEDQAGDLGWEEDELAELLAVDDDEPTGDGGGEPDAPTPPSDPQCKAGDILDMGPHRVVCGDCRDPDVVDRLLGDEKINVAFTSPPYASQRKYDESSGFKPIAPDDYVEWFDAVQANVRAHLAYDGSWFVNIKEHCDGGERDLYVKDLTIAHKRLWGWWYVDELCWHKTGVPGRWDNRLRNDWEPVFHYSLGSAMVRHSAISHPSNRAVHGTGGSPKTPGGAHGLDESWSSEGEALAGNVVRVSTGGGSSHSHEAAFPIGLPRFFILAYSDETDIVFDPFMGSGTTMLAAHRTKRVARGCEISPAYCDVIAARWCAESGGEAWIVRDGERLPFVLPA